MTEKGEDGTWYTGQEALAAGLVDELTSVPDDQDAEAVANRLSGWEAILPEAGRTLVAEYSEPEYDESPAPEPVTDDGADLAFAMLAAGLK